MPRITELPALAQATSGDVIPIVDDSGNITKKVTADKVVPNGSVTNSQLANDAVDTAQIADGAVTDDKIDFTTLPSYAFRVYLTSNWNPASAYNGNALASGATVDYNDGTTVSSIGVFTAPVDGYYDFSGALSRSAAVNCQLGIGKNGAVVGYNSNSSSSSISRITASVSGLKLNAGDTVQLHLDSSASPSIAGGSANTWFMGHLSRNR